MEERYEGKSIGLVARYVLGTMQDFGGKIFSAHAGRSGKSQQFDDIADLSNGVWRRKQQNKFKLFEGEQGVAIKQRLQPRRLR